MSWTCPTCQTVHPEAGLHTLTRMERLVLQALVNGRRPRKLAADLGLSYHTIRTHQGHIYDKLDAHGEIEAISYAICHGMTPESEVGMEMPT